MTPFILPWFYQGKLNETERNKHIYSLWINDLQNKKRQWNAWFYGTKKLNSKPTKSLFHPGEDLSSRHVSFSDADTRWNLFTFSPMLTALQRPRTFGTFSKFHDDTDVSKVVTIKKQCGVQFLQVFWECEGHLKTNGYLTTPFPVTEIIFRSVISLTLKLCKDFYSIGLRKNNNIIWSN